jgi:uncharacterized protein (DUF433 family)
MIILNDKICGGDPTIQNSRITVVNVLEWLRSGETIEEIANDNYLTQDAVRECISYAINKIK